MNREINKLRRDLRIAMAEYVATEGCGCCSDRDGHEAAAGRIAKLLRVKPYGDGSGYDWNRYQPKNRK